MADYLARSVAVRVGSMSTAILVQVLGLALPAPFVIAGLARNGLDVDWGTMAIWAPMSAACLGLAYLAYYTGLHRGPVAMVTSAASAWIAVTVAVTVLFFGEHITPTQTVLMGAVLAGILMLSAQPSTRSGGSGGLLWGLGAMVGWDSRSPSWTASLKRRTQWLPCSSCERCPSSRRISSPGRAAR